MRVTTVMRDPRYMWLAWAVGLLTLERTSFGSINCEEAVRCRRHGEPPPRLQEMKDDKQQKKRSGGNSSEIGAIRVFSNPGPDAEDRLRRVVTLMVKHATRDREAKPSEDSSLDDYQAEDCAGRDA